MRPTRYRHRLSRLDAMPPVPVPPEVDAFLARPNPAVVATVSPSGAPHTAATWYDWEDGRVLLNMDESRLRLRYLRQNPAVSLTVLARTAGTPMSRCSAASSRSRTTRSWQASTGSRSATTASRSTVGTPAVS